MTTSYDITKTSPEKIISDLTYFNYAHNRTMHPEVTPETWDKAYPNANAMEERYQRELKELRN
jgi:hypothetical protein